MSEDGLSDSFEEPNIEIQIKTLMGTTFDIKVSLHDTVSAIKKKIFRVEGIPVYQQNLIFRSQELKDTSRLCDSGIRNGSTITLVSAMRGGPISTRRLSVSCEHYLLKELKDLLENSRDEMSPGSKVSVLVFKEGDIINLLRVIENEDGSYSPYNEGPISPPSKPSRRDTIEAFERLVEDTVMCTKVALLRKKMDQVNVRRQTRNLNASEIDLKPDDELTGSQLKDEKSKNISYQLLEGPAGQLVDVDLTIFENNSDEGNQSESEEIALKDKHRTKPKVLQSITVPKANPKSLYSERKGSYSHTRQNYTRIAKRRESRLFEKSEVSPNGCITFSRDRIIDHDESSSSLDKTLLNNNLGNLHDRLGDSGILPSLNDLEGPNLSRLPRMDTSSENPYLLQGLNSSKLPDLRILEKNDFLRANSNKGMLENSTGSSQQVANDNSPFLNVPLSSYLGGNAPRTGTTAKILPDLANRIAQRNFGPLVPDIASNNPNLMDSRTANSAPVLNSLPLASAYTITRNVTPTHTLESTSFCNMELSSNKLPRSSYSLANTNKVSPHSPSLDSPVSNLTRLEPLANLSGSRGESPILGATGGPSVEEVGTQLAEQLQLFDEESNGDVYGESYSVSRNRVHLTRLVLASEGVERPKSSPDSIELEEHTQDLWEIHEPASERLKRSATCKVGLLKRRQGVEYNYDSLENPQSNLKPELSNMGNYSQSSAEFGVCSGANFYMPQYLSAPSAIPPQYAPKHHPKYCDLFFTNEPRSPLYNRRNRRENLEANKSNKSSSNVGEDCSNIERLKNDDQLFGSKTEFSNDDLFGYCNLGCATDLVERFEESNEVVKLPPVIKKKSRCNECNKRLNITNIYNCRCGRIFCSQHRYSEAHRCTYDYKTEGKKILERQNPLVTAQKVQRF